MTHFSDNGQSMSILSCIYVIMKIAMILCPFTNHYILQASAIPSDYKTSGNQLIKIPKLEEFSWRMILKNIPENNRDDLFKILNRIKPEIFNRKSIYKQKLALADLIKSDKLDLTSELDLSNLNLKSIPEFISSKMMNVEKLDLSNNPLLNFEDEWFSKIAKNLKTMIFVNESTNNSGLDIGVFNEAKNLKSLTIKPPILKIATRNVKNVLKRLSHLDISGCKFDSGSSIDSIFKYGKNLNSLKLSNVYCKGYFSLDHGKIFSEERCLRRKFSKLKNLESINLSNCSLDAHCLQYLFMFPALKKINLSGNSFQNLTLQIVKKLFERKRPFISWGNDKTFQKHSFVFKNASFNSLEEINISNTNLYSTDFIQKLFNLKSLKSLTLVQSSFNFELNFSKLCFKPVNSPKKLNSLFFCSESNNDQNSNYQSESSLKYLKINGIFINDNSKFMAFLHQFKSLETLDISNCKLQPLDESFSFGPLTDSLTSLKVNQTVDSSIKWNTHGLNAIAKCKQLKHLEAVNNNFSGSTESIKFEFENTIESMNLQSCNMNHFGFISCLSCKNLKTLNFNINDLGKLTKDKILVNHSLERLSLLETELPAIAFHQILFSLSNLTLINAGYNDFADFTCNLKFINPSKALKTLIFDSTKLNTTFLSSLTHIESLENLELSNFDLSTSAEIQLGLSMKKLEISGSKINISLLKSILDSKSLEKLHISFSELIPSIESKTNISCLSLKYLVLNNVTNTSSLLSSLKSIPSLEIIKPMNELESKIIQEQVIRLKSMAPLLKYSLEGMSHLN